MPPSTLLLLLLLLLLYRYDCIWIQWCLLYLTDGELAAPPMTGTWGQYTVVSHSVANTTAQPAAFNVGGSLLCIEWHKKVISPAGDVCCARAWPAALASPNLGLPAEQLCAFDLCCDVCCCS